MALHPKIIDLSLDRMWQILEKLGHPERQLPPVLHVAGTNGKGSLLAYLRAILEAGGYSVHVYTSPHLVTFAERIRLAGKIIDEPALEALLAECERINGPTPITYFEITTAAAFKAFAETPADILLLETGLGGRLDATNVVEKPIVTAITPISQDHAQYLGTDIVGIAGEKAGIMRSDVPVVVGPQTDIVQKALLAIATEKGAKPYTHGRDWLFSQSEEGWSYEGRSGKASFSLPALPGIHQVGNAATALACLDHLRDYRVTSTQIETGLQTVDWPGRMHRLTKGRIIDSLPDDLEIWLDGGHNPAAGAQIAKTFANWNEKDPRRNYIIAGMLNTKDQGSFFNALKDVIESGFTVPIDDQVAATSAEELAELAANAGIHLIAQSSLKAAIDALKLQLNGRRCRLLITGSLYLAGQVLRENETELN